MRGRGGGTAAGSARVPARVWTRFGKAGCSTGMSVPAGRYAYNQWSPDVRALELVGEKWTLLIVRDLAAGPRRPGELERVLPGIPRALLRSRLNRLVAEGLVTRTRYPEMPPRVEFELTERAWELMPLVAELARWGRTWAWSLPRPSERVDIGAILRLAPELVPADGVRGEVELHVVGGEAAHGSSLFTVALLGDRTVVMERGAVNPAAQVAGEVDGWVRALGPRPTWQALRIEGDHALASRVLDGLVQTRVPTEKRAHG